MLLSFSDLGLPLPVQKAVAALSFSEPTPIQAEAIPLALQGKDLIGVAQTGTGKTAAFCLPILTRLLADTTSTALILAPTRELVLQIEAFWRNLTRGIPEASCACLIGGLSMKQQLRELAHRPRLIVATPGRLLDHLNRRTAGLAHCQLLVLDEADRMLDMGFAPQLTQIRRYLPESRQTLLFTATWDTQMDRLSQSYLHEPARVTVGAASRPVESVEQTVILTQQKSKNSTLLDAINARRGSVLVFTRTQIRTDRVAKYLASFGLEVGRIHGSRSQEQRTSAMNAFRQGRIQVLVATDIAARGLDVAAVAHVINYDLPMVAEDYVHRIGRTGRAGATGTALSFITAEDRDLWREITKLLQRSGAPVPEIPGEAHEGAVAGRRGKRPDLRQNSPNAIPSDAPTPAARKARPPTKPARRKSRWAPSPFTKSRRSR